MQRRAFLSSSVLVPLAGCTGSSENSTPDENSDQEANNQREESVEDDAYAQIGVNQTTSTGLAISVQKLELANSIELSSGDVLEHPEEIFVLAKLSATNEAEEPQDLPTTREIALVTGDSQYNNLREEAFIEDGIEIKDPVDGSFYTGQTEAHPQVSSEGWFVFQVPREVSSVEVAWSRETIESETLYWEGSVDPGKLPNLRLGGINGPEQVEVGEKFWIDVEVENHGGSTGSFSSEYELSVPSGDDPTERLEFEVPGGEEKTQSISYRAAALGTITLNLSEIGQSHQIEVTRATRQMGESFRVPLGPKITVENVVLDDSYSYEEYSETKTVEAGSGMQFAFINLTMSNPTSESQIIPPADQILVKTSGNTYEFSAMDTFSEPAFIAPVTGKEYYNTFTNSLNAGESINRWMAFEIPTGQSLSDLAVQADWEIDWDTRIGVRWTIE
jgi:hypothetical protein